MSHCRKNSARCYHKYSDIKFHENLCGGSRVVGCKPTDMKPLVACRSSAHAHKNEPGSVVRSFVVCPVHVFAARMRETFKPASRAQSSLHWLEVYTETNSQPTRGWSCNVVYCVCGTVGTNLTWCLRRKFATCQINLHFIVTKCTVTALNNFIIFCCIFLHVSATFSHVDGDI